MSSPGLLLGIDGGQTSTKSMLATADGRVLATGRGGPSDHFHVEGGVEKNRAAIQGAIRDSLSRQDEAGERVLAVGIGLTGAMPGGDLPAVVGGIVREILPHMADSRIAITPDYRTNLLGASGGRPGVVLIAGGGCIAYGITEDGREALAGGFGYLIGDEGSAFGIGLRAIRAACKASDGRGPATSLQHVVLEHFGIDTIRQIAGVVYRAGFSRDQISLLTPKVVEAADAGDEEARLTLADAACEAALAAIGVFRQLYQPGESAAVYLTGGVFRAGDVILNPFREALESGWPGAESRWPRFPPVVGGLILAARAAVQDVDVPWLDRIEETIGSFLQ